jgi:hypothetical protein
MIFFSSYSASTLDLKASLMTKVIVAFLVLTDRLQKRILKEAITTSFYLLSTEAT